MRQRPAHPRPPGTKASRLRDHIWQRAYRLAYLLCRCFWFVFRPRGKGSLVAIWHNGQLLLVRNAYRRGYSLPGGSRRSGESARRAAVREIREEVGLGLYSNQLRYRGTVLSSREHLRDHCAYFEAHLDSAPRIEIDAREVVEAIFVAPAAWSNLPLSRQVRTYLQRWGDPSTAL